MSGLCLSYVPVGIPEVQRIYDRPASPQQRCRFTAVRWSAVHMSISESQGARHLRQALRLTSERGICPPERIMRHLEHLSEGSPVVRVRASILSAVHALARAAAVADRPVYWEPLAELPARPAGMVVPTPPVFDEP